MSKEDKTKVELLKLKLYLEALDEWGLSFQMIMVFEETGEFMKALSKHFRHETYTSKLNLQEEIADLEIMLQQVRVMFKLDEDKIEMFRQAKLQKLRKELKNADCKAQNCKRGEKYGE